MLFVARKPCTDEKQMLNDKLRRVGEDKITTTKVCVSTYSYSYTHLNFYKANLVAAHNNCMWKVFTLDFLDQ